MLALTLAACATSTQAPSGNTAPIPLSPATQGELTQYLARVKVTRPGAFAVSPDGRNSFYTYCEDIACATSSYSAPALRGCQSFSGTPCLVLYVRNEQRLAFTRSEDASAGGRHGSEEQRELDFDVHDRN
jgi:hypothetical protein